MKTLLLSLGLLLGLPRLVSAQEDGSLEALNEKYGFRDAHFESPPSAFKGLVLVSPGKTIQGYHRPSDSKKVGGAELSSIYYSFYKGKLSAVLLKTKGLANSRALLDALRAQYGEGEQPNEFLKNYWWPAGRVTMSYKQNPLTDDATVVLMSTYMSEQQKTDEAAAAKKAGGDL